MAVIFAKRLYGHLKSWFLRCHSLFLIFLDWFLELLASAFLKIGLPSLLPDKPFGKIFQPGTNCDFATVQVEQSCHLTTEQRRLHRNQQFFG